MAIALDAVNATITKEDVTPVSSLSHSHTCAGSDRILFAYVWTNSTTGNVSGVTYNGVAMTHVASSSTGTHELQIWKLQDPDTGTHDIVASFPSSTLARLGGISYTGAPGGVNASSTFAAASAPYSVTTTVDDCWVILFKHNGQSTLGTGATFRFSDSGADNRFNVGYDSNGSVGAAGSHEISCSSTNYGVVVAISPTAVVSASRRLLLLGIGN